MIKEEDFIKKNIDTWNDLENILKNFYKGGRKNYTKEQIDDLIIKYNQVTNHLAYSRSNYGNNDTTEYLNKLAASAHAIIYSTPRKEVKSMLMFFVTDFPQLLRKNFKYLITSSLLFIITFLAVFLLVAHDFDNAYLFVDPDSLLDESIGPANQDTFFFSSLVVTNNLKVSFLAFAMGLTFGIGPAYIMITNGALLGALMGVFGAKGQLAFFWAHILPHGVPELFAIFVCGAAGLMIGYALINPGKMSRKDALITRGKEAIQLVIGCIPILVIAAIIEGYFTPMPIDYIYKFLFSLAEFTLLCVYIALPGKKKVVSPAR